MGFDDREIVALSGGHTLGRCHKVRSGFDGPWTQDPLKFDNSYFVNLVTFTWSKRKWDGPEQYEDSSKRFMMLPTDIALKTDPHFRVHVERYAADESAFRAEFAVAFAKLLALGCPAQCQPAAAGTAPDAPPSPPGPAAEFREHAMHGSLEHCRAIAAHAGASSVAHGSEANSGRTALMKVSYLPLHFVRTLLTI